MIPTGDITVRMQFTADEPKPGTGGQVTLFVNNKKIGGGRIPRTVPLAFSTYAGMDIGRDNGLVVDRAYEDEAPYAFTGTVKRVVFDLTPATTEDEKKLHEAAQHANMPTEPPDEYVSNSMIWVRMAVSMEAQVLHTCPRKIVLLTISSSRAIPVLQSSTLMLSQLPPELA